MKVSCQKGAQIASHKRAAAFFEDCSALPLVELILPHGQKLLR
jgi:hypothetical protein